MNPSKERPPLKRVRSRLRGRPMEWALPIRTRPSNN
jgi:hypothetical protein